jgi:hypothetical protein
VQFAQGGVGQTEDTEQQSRHGAEFGAGLPGGSVDEGDELAGGAGVRVVGKVPHLARGVGVLAEDGETFADVRDVGVGVWLVGVAEHGGGPARQSGREDPVAEVGLGAAAGTEVVRGAPDRDRDASGLMGREQVPRHPAPQLSLPGVGVMSPVLGERPAGGASVHVDVLHADQPGAGGLGGGDHTSLQGGELCDPLVVRRVEGLVDDGSTLRHRGGEGGVAGVAADDLDVVADPGVPGAVDQPDGLTTAPQRLEGGQADRAGPEDHVPGGGHTVTSVRVGPWRGSTAARPGRS